MLEVVAAGPLTTVQDLGRPGHARWGVGAAGAADRGALRLANRLVGNDPAAAGLEVTFGGLRLRAGAAVHVALTGAACPATVDEQPVGHAALLHLRAGAELRLGAPRTGVRTYVGVRGGIDVPVVLGSRSTDVLAGLGPAVVTGGTVLPVGRPHGPLPDIDQAPVREPPGDDVVLRVRRGPRDDWFSAAASAQLVDARWVVGADSDRVGLRLTGPALERSDTAVDRELASEGVVPGALQVPPSGRPTLLLTDHPLTGGYPVLAVVADADVDAAAQLRPGQGVRFSAPRR
jgi:biotin-dependent carboxylase-like uncharacterized protein